MRVQQMAEIVGLTVKVQTVDWEDLAAGGQKRWRQRRQSRWRQRRQSRWRQQAAKQMATASRQAEQAARRYKGT